MIPPFAHLAKYRSKMTATEKSSKKGLVILFVGMMIGIGVGIAACVTAMAHFSSPSATTVAYQQIPAVVPTTAPTIISQQYSQDGSVFLPASTTVIDTSPIVITAGSVNPNWTMGKNGLIQNPCVDPPSAHGRATGQY